MRQILLSLEPEILNSCASGIVYFDFILFTEFEMFFHDLNFWLTIMYKLYTQQIN